MKSKLTLVNEDNDEVIHRVFDWGDSIEIEGGTQKVEKLSVFDDRPIIAGVPYRIAHMLSAESFNQPHQKKEVKLSNKYTI